MRIQHYKVEGCGRFPIDMLRYDQSWPETDRDSGLIAGNAVANGYMVSLCRNVTSLKDYPGEDRWASCGWSVIEDSVTTY